MRVLNAEDVTRLLTMDDCIDAMDRAMRSLARDDVAVPPRLIMPLIDDTGLLFVMPGSSRTIYGAKVIGLRPDNPRRGRPTIQGFVALFDPETGTPLAIVDGGTITGMRTAAASGLATRELARPDAKSHGVFGTGVQAASHIDAVAAVRDIDEVVVWGRSKEKAQALAQAEAERTGLSIRAAEDPKEAAACDVVSTVTGASGPILEGAWLTPGAHVNLVGAHSPTTREADSAAITRAGVFVETLEAALREAGDILIPIEEGVFSKEAIRGTIGEVLLGLCPGRTEPNQITLYKSLGNTAQDLFAANAIFERALAADAGVEIDW